MGSFLATLIDPSCYFSILHAFHCIKFHFYEYGRVTKGGKGMFKYFGPSFLKR